MTDRARELLERALLVIDDLSGPNLRSVDSAIKDISEYLAEPKVPFVRLTEEEVNSLTYAPLEPYELICAVENRLVEKNK